MDFDRAEQVLRALEREGVRYAVLGGAALNFHGIARFTEDVDLFIAPERENIDRFAELLRDRFRLEDD